MKVWRWIQDLSVFEGVIYLTAASCLHRLEKRLLSNVEYFDDYCITHEDEKYMQNQYDLRIEQKDNYFVRTYPTW